MPISKKRVRPTAADPGEVDTLVCLFGSMSNFIDARTSFNDETSIFSPSSQIGISQIVDELELPGEANLPSEDTGQVSEEGQIVPPSIYKDIAGMEEKKHRVREIQAFRAGRWVDEELRTGFGITDILSVNNDPSCCAQIYTDVYLEPTTNAKRWRAKGVRVLVGAPLWVRTTLVPPV